MLSKKPEILVIAGPNGSGKSTITSMTQIVGEAYINADEIKRTNLCSDLEAAQLAEELRNRLVNEGKSFTFETVMSTTRNLELIKRAKEKGYFIRCVYVLTADPLLNVYRVKVRKDSGGHDVPPDKIVSRYSKALNLLPSVIEACDICHIYDNTSTTFRIFKKRKTEYFFWENQYWSKEDICNLTKITL